MDGCCSDPHPGEPVTHRPHGTPPAGRRVVAVGAVLATICAGVAGVITTASSAGATAPTWHSVSGLTAVGSVTVRDLPAAPSPGHPGLRKPYLSPHLQTPATTAPARAVPRVDVGQASPGPSTPALSTTTTTATALSVLGGFPTWSSAQSQSTFNQSLAPPDAQVAAGPDTGCSADGGGGCLLEMVNDVGSVWPKTGGAPARSFDLAAFFKVPAGQTFSDPRVVYDVGPSDSPVGRWFATGLSFTSSYGSQVYIAVSQTSDPSGAWWVYTGAASSNVLHDQPKIGLSADKVVMAWNDFLSASFFEGSTTWVIQKSALLTGGSPAISSAGPDANRPSIAPAQNLSYTSADTTAYAVYNNSPTVGLLSITGTPGVNVAMSETDPTMGTTGSPPNADQPGHPGTIATNDTRFLGATWQGGTLWTSANDGCGSPVAACGRVVAATTGGTPAVTFSTDLAYSGGGLYYPAVSVDSSGDMFAVYTVSSSTLDPSVRAIAATNGPSGYTLVSGATLQTGQSIYGYGSCLSSGPCRWGDYEGAAADPSNPGDVWVTGQMAAANTVGNNWGTYTSELSLSAAPPANDFSIGASPASLSVAQGGSGASTITTAVTSGSAQTVTLGASGLPPGASAAFNPTSITGNGSSTMTITVGASTATGTYTVTVTGTGISATHSTSVTLTVSAAPPANDFSIGASPASLSVAQGGSGASTITTAVTSGSAQTVALSASGLPAGASASFNPGSITGNGSSTMTITVGASTATGTYTVTVTGTGTSATHSTTVTLTVTTAPPPNDFSIGASPTSLTVHRRNSTHTTIQITLTSGVAQTVTLSITGLPAGVTASFAPGSVAGTGSSTLTITASSSAVLGNFTLTITGSGQSAAHSTTVSLHVRN